MILGGGTGGTITANRLRRTLPASIDITVVDSNNDHIYQPGLLFVPFGLTEAEHLIRPRDRQLHHGIDYMDAVVESVDMGESQVHFSGGRSASYDVLVIATGAVLMPEETEGLDLSVAATNMFTFYSLDGARALRDALAAFTAGRIVVNVVDMPIKCPVAPLEFCSWRTGSSGSAGYARTWISRMSRHSTACSPSRSRQSDSESSWQPRESAS
jgi:sulfide:quinone oxidoreductase